MPTTVAPFAGLTESRYSHLLARCRECGVPFYDDAGVAEQLQRVLLASDFAYDCFSRDPALMAPDALMLMSDPRPADARVYQLDATERDEARQMSALRRFRKREALRLIWRDVNGLDEVADTLAGSSTLAETCIELALRYAEAHLGARHGSPRDSAGKAQRLVVLGLGKLGGGELNFSSDVDLILAYAENGQTDGARVVDNETFFARVGQQMVKLLAEVTADGYVYRVDLRLRPFGHSGRVALSFAAMEQYYQREGRNWERYAWIKARPVAGDLGAGKRLTETLRPFVYRRYLDYTAFAGLREMKALIDAEVARKDLTDNLKLGPGGIREVEFIVQLLQMIRGGREPSLRVRGLLPALAACEQLGLFDRARAAQLRQSYLFLRRVENRLQMLRDEQTHALPGDADLVGRIARALDFPDADAFGRALTVERAIVAEEFRQLLAPLTPETHSPTPDSWITLWRAIDADGNGDTTAALEAAGFVPGEPVREALVGLARSPSVRVMAASSRERFDRLMPQLLQAAAATRVPAACLERLVRLLHAIVRRAAYLVLLDEQPGARRRLIALFADSAWLAERVIAHPLLLDDLFDPRLEQVPVDRRAIEGEIARRVATLDEADAEAEIEVLQELKHSLGFRLGLAFLARRADAVQTARRMAVLAESIIAAVLAQAERDAIRQHGRMPGHATDGSGLGIVGYGSLGAAELGFASDLDLVFLYDESLGQAESDGPRPLDGQRYFARIAQRVVHLLTTLTRAGRLYEVDVRLRPDGGKGLLVTSVQGFADYQRERAWTWEHQALVRSRFLAGDPQLALRFDQARSAVLGQPRQPSEVLRHVADMRARWRAERDRSNAVELDLKQGAGALLDIEFLLQALVLAHAADHRELLASSDSGGLIRAAAKLGLFDEPQATQLLAAHACLLERALTCTLDARPRIAPRDDALDEATTVVLEVAHSVGLAVR
ncbi:bifunctional [glutamate--ammonia ligase]-adenylyl-L-tyrosine phosphorylase/[glutamate--ammonia-ligase] adenylyltransferase [Tahibacter amnicola]|uniref:Bifunctional glutamine synthetase adenylyltransferase/adenylyl-removing enzyme n=1 Tax=Tahibacter amnicola TaxID=2976241 RepID=A0ABY6BE73_9GAMM|nr:bifunctional [glutamate--ammonia ligase]-adenylyl-L-tyrosine phosphorylase/[glutamate--ammonia-ligase] adenylyltransferase [Tahibacter amnicola]UXI67852.1 bifunctional [glutamate--ammonia ligase]-adenylyl-L-tyrosine phosphorylase/[glutamate--ammonia-ligase] adenylyltransferase [Tahibacter amnicola]